MLFPGEIEAIQTVLALGAKYGYGNLIAHLRRAWALDLKSKHGGTFEQHLPATNSDAYPEKFSINLNVCRTTRELDVPIVTMGTACRTCGGCEYQCAECLESARQ